METLALLIVLAVALLVLAQSYVYRRQTAARGRPEGLARSVRWVVAAILGIIAVLGTVLFIAMGEPEYLPISFLVIVSAGLMFGHNA